MSDCPACDTDHARGSPDCPGRRVGTTFHGKYELLRVLGCGGMGAVYEAKHLELGRHCAIKLMLPSMARTTTAADRFVQEARRVAKLEHEGIVRIHDTGRDASGTQYIEMELLRGQSLEAWRTRGPSRSIDASLDVIGRVLDALAVAHARGIVHRDLKPENIFLVTSGDAISRVVLLDFGIARDETASTQQTQEGTMLGTLAFMSPEQMRDASTADARSDVFAVGAIAYLLCTGQLVLSGNRGDVIAALATGSYPRSIRALRPALSPRLDKAIADALDPDRERRPRDAATFAALLRGARSAPAPTELEDVPVPAAKPAPAPTELEGEPVALPPSPTAPAAVATNVATVHGRRRYAVWIAGGVVAAAIPIAIVIGSDRDAPRPPIVAHTPDAASPADAPASVDATVVAPEMARVAGGSVELGIADPEAFRSWCRANERDKAYCDELLARLEPGRAEIATFDLDRHEVTRAELAAWLTEEIARGAARVNGATVVRASDGAPLAKPACHAVNGLVLAGDRVVVTREGDRAASCMTVAAAAAFCAARDKRLPSHPEWTLAASALDLSRATCADAVFGRVDGGPCAKLPEGPDRVGDAGLDITAAGIRGLAGNVSEWVDAPPRDGKLLACGGSWAGGIVDLHPKKRMWLTQKMTGVTTVGFRCARTVTTR